MNNQDPCGQIALCVWRTATLLTNAGRPTRPVDLCIAIGSSGEPCGRKAFNTLAGTEDSPGQPFCEHHWRSVIDDAWLRIQSSNYTPKSTLEEMRYLRRELDKYRIADRTKSKRQRRRDWVYFCRIDQVVKIGHTVNLPARLTSFASYGHDIELLALEAGGVALEKRLHRRFAVHRSTVGLSRELFNMDPEVMDYIRNGRSCVFCSSKAQLHRVVCETHNPAWFEGEDLVSGWTFDPEPSTTT